MPGNHNVPKNSGKASPISTMLAQRAAPPPMPPTPTLQGLRAPAPPAPMPARPMPAPGRLGPPPPPAVGGGVPQQILPVDRAAMLAKLFSGGGVGRA